MAEPPVAVVGAGLMGSGIAACFAAAGHEVAVHDPIAKSLAAAPGRIATCLEAMGVGDAEAGGSDAAGGAGGSDATVPGAAVGVADSEATQAAVAAALSRVRFESRPQDALAGAGSVDRF